MILQPLQPSDSKSIFLSYRSVEVEFALRLAADLKNAGINVWMDRLDIAPGDDWLLMLQRAVNECAAVIAILSPEYIASRYCQRELARADRLDRIIFPVLLRHVPKDEWPLVIERSQYVDFTGWQNEQTYEERLQNLIETIRTRFSDQVHIPLTPELRYINTLIADLETRRGVIEYLEPFTLVSNLEKEEAVRPQPVFAKTWNMHGHFQLVRNPQDDRPSETPRYFKGIYDVLDKHTRCMLVGGPGTGKTTTLNHLVLEAAHQYRASSGIAPLPLYLKLTRWEDGQSVADFIRSQWPIEGDPMRLMAKGKVSLYLDGLSELGDQSASRIERLRTWLHSAQAPQRIVITCRESDFEAGLDLGLPVIQTVDLTLQHINEFVEYYLDEREASEFLSYILPTEDNNFQPNRYLHQIARTPYLLSVMIVIYKRSVDGQPFRNVGTVLQRLVAELWQSRRKQNNDERLPFHRMETALADLAFALTDQNMPVFVPIDWASEYLGGEIIMQAAINANLLEIDGGSLRFSYQMLQDYFAALGLHRSGLSAQLSHPQFDSRIRRVPTRWDEAVHILAGIATDPDATLLTIAETDPYLALSCALNAVPVKAETFESITRILISNMEGDRRVAMARLFIGNDDSRAMLILLECMRDGIWPVRQAAALAAAEITVNPLEGLAEAIEDLDDKTRETAGAALKRYGKDALPSLIQFLRSPNWNYRRGAAWALGELKDKAGVPLLVPCLTDSEALVAAEAAVAIGRLKDENGISGLQAALGHENWRVNKAAARALAFIGKAAISALLHVLEAKTSSLRQQVRALEALGGINDERAVRALLEATRSTNADIRGVSLEGLRNKRGDAITQRLIDLLQDHAKPRNGKLTISEIAVDILQGINTESSRRALEEFNHHIQGGTLSSARKGHERLRSIRDGSGMAAVDLSNSLTHPDWKVRRDAVMALAASGSAVAVPRLINALKDDDSQVRLAAVNTLILMKDDIRVVPALMKALSDSDVLVSDGAKEALKKIARPPVPGLLDLLRGDDVNVRGAAAEILGSLRDSEAIPDLRDCLSDIRKPWLSNFSISDIALRALETIGTPAAHQVIQKWKQSQRPSNMLRPDHQPVDDQISQLLLTLHSDDWEARDEAAKTLRAHVRELRGMVTPDVINQLVALLHNHNWFVRWAAVQALATLGEPSAMSSLLTMLSDPRPSVRVGTIQALIEIGDRNAVPSILPLLGDRNSSVREAAIEALGILGDPRGVESLISLLKDAETLIRLTAITALGKIGDRRATMPLIKGLREGDPATRWFSAEALGRLKDPTAVNDLIELLKDQDGPHWEDKKICEIAAESLEMIGTPEARAAIVRWHSKQAGTNK